MNEERIWNDESRDRLRKSIQSLLLGELRLARHGREEILETWCKDRIRDQCPDSEWSDFSQFAADEFTRAAMRLEAEKSEWPKETDCDRLDRVEIALRRRSIVMWQVSPCCGTCTVSEFPQRIELIKRRHSDSLDSVRGYAFFIDQNMPSMLAKGTEVKVDLGYGWLFQDGSEVAPDVYSRNAVGIGHELCECLRNEGFEPDWSGSLSRKIGISLNWRRRTMLE